MTTFLRIIALAFMALGLWTALDRDYQHGMNLMIMACMISLRADIDQLKKESKQ